MTHYQTFKLAFNNLTNTQLRRFKAHLDKGHKVICDETRYVDDEGHG